MNAWYAAERAALRRYAFLQASRREVPASVLDPDDVVQDAFMELHGTLYLLMEPAAWLRTVAQRRIARAHHGMGRVAARDVIEHLVVDAVGGRWSSLTRTATVDDAVAVRELLRMIEELPDRQRAVVYLRHIEGDSTDSIAERLGIAVATIRVHLHRGIKALREARWASELVPRTPSAWVWCPCWSKRPQPVYRDHQYPAELPAYLDPDLLLRWHTEQVRRRYEIEHSERRLWMRSQFEQLMGERLHDT